MTCAWGIIFVIKESLNLLVFSDWRIHKINIIDNVLVESYLWDSNKLDGENYASWKFKLYTLMGGYTI